MPYWLTSKGLSPVIEWRYYRERSRRNSSPENDILFDIDEGELRGIWVLLVSRNDDFQTGVRGTVDERAVTLNDRLFVETTWGMLQQFGVRPPPSSFSKTVARNLTNSFITAVSGIYQTLTLGKTNSYSSMLCICVRVQPLTSEI